MSHWPEDKKAAWDEARIVKIFRSWLEAQGWTVEAEADFLDLLAVRGDDRLLVEAKGRTTGRPGLSVDALYGQILRRISDQGLDDRSTRFALVVPERLEGALLRISLELRATLKIDLYVVTDDDRVRQVADP